MMNREQKVAYAMGYANCYNRYFHSVYPCFTDFIETINELVNGRFGIKNITQDELSDIIECYCSDVEYYTFNEKDGVIAFQSYFVFVNSEGQFVIDDDFEYDRDCVE